MAAHLPSKYMGAVQFGAGSCGIVCNMLRGLSLWVFPDGPEQPDPRLNAFKSAIMFFTFAGFFYIACIFIHLFYTRKTDFYRYYLDWELAESEELV